MYLLNFILCHSGQLDGMLMYGDLNFENLDQSQLMRDGLLTSPFTKDEYLSIYLYTTEWFPKEASVYR